MFHFSVMLLLTSCGGRQADHVLGKADSGKSVEMKPGEIVEISLDQCQGCEETWQNSSEWGDCLVMTKDEFIPNCADCNGGGGKRIFWFDGKKPGRAMFEFSYYGDTVKYTITVLNPAK